MTAIPRRLSVLLLSALLAGCGGATPVATGPTATPVTPITREKAIEIARNECWNFHLELVGEPRNVRVQLTTLHDANQRAELHGGYPSDNWPLSTVVWLVQMDASAQLEGSVLPTPGGPGLAPTPKTIEATCAVSIDAATGQGIGLSEHSL